MRYQTTIDETREFVVETGGERFDKFLGRVAPDFSRTFLQQLVADGLATLNGKAAKAGQKLRGGETVGLQIPRPVEMSAAPEDLPLDILYEDAAVIVVNKPAGLVAHPSPGHETGTLVNALLGHCRDLSGIGGELRPGIVHRLDRDTTGCLVAAKSDAAHQALAAQFAARAVRKKYLAITRGLPRPPAGKVEGYIMRQAADWQRLRFVPRESSGGKYSLTFYRTLATRGEVALVECDLKTGRTHQIRLHLKSVGAPVLCDALYGRESEITLATLRGEKAGEAAPLMTRQALHAAELAFAHPLTGENLTFSAPLPPDMQTLVERLELKVES
ncbi:pseudouridine synthase [Planctomycetales bacterium]|nr:pseudouridine synthase [Planctomycetales bacterium]GHS99904.1 pseudouridine synthase [Planctomycetales bacterium]GHT06702.1 pseudouridine synthase [Planctomycetales bacterium]